MSRALLTLTAALVLAGVVNGQETPPEFVVRAVALPEAPTIDGRLDEEVWRQAALLERFVQMEPEEGAPASERTEVRIGYDARRLYLGVRCWDSRPEAITAATMDRDGSLRDEDSVHVVLDTFFDRQSAFLFAVNPLGAKVDALVRAEGNEVNYNWDGIWKAATSRDETGWSAEIAIPFRTLRFPEKDEQTWGLNVQRVVIRTREYLLWRPIPRYSTSEALFKMSQAGELRGLENLERGRSYDLKPYVLAKREESDLSGDGSELDAGLEVRKYLTSDLVLDLTYNLDFAEAEADRQQINLTRFELLFPEQRDFFLEGANLFYFGDRADLLWEPERIFFFSRRIGLTADGLRQIPVLGGAKVSGRHGPWGIGFLNLTTDKLAFRDRDGGDRFEPQTSYTVLRLKRDVLKTSAVGLMWLDKAASGGAAGDNRGAGVDWDFAFGDRWKTGGFLARTTTPGREGDDWAAYADVVREGPQSFLRGVYSEVGEDFNPEMGFFTRFGIRHWRGNAVYELRPQRWDLRSVWLFGDLHYITDRDGNVETRTGRLETNFMWQKRYGFAVKLFDHLEVLTSGFEISEGVVIPPGEYDFNNYFIGVESPRGKRVWVFLGIDFGELYDGDYAAWWLETEIRPRARGGLIAKLSYKYTDVDLPAGRFDVNLAAARIIYSLSPALSFSTFAQWRQDDNFSVKLLAQWLYAPGAAFYVAYDELRDLRGRQEARFRESALSAKVGFFF